MILCLDVNLKCESCKVLFLPSLTPKDLLSMTSHQHLHSQGPLLDMCAKQCTAQSAGEAQAGQAHRNEKPGF